MKYIKRTHKSLWRFKIPNKIGVGLFIAQQVIIVIRIVLTVPMLSSCCAFALVTVAPLQLCFGFANYVTIRVTLAIDLLYICNAFAVHLHELHS